MIKYSKINLGQMEAVMNKLGGPEGVERFLSDRLEVVPKLPTEEPVQKAERTYFESYQSAVALLQLLRGWGHYASTDGKSHFAIIAARLADRVRNFAQAGIKEWFSHSMSEDVRDEMLDQVEALRGFIREFQTREGFEVPCSGIADIKEGLRKKDHFMMLTGACRLSASLRAAEEVCEQLLAE